MYILKKYDTFSVKYTEMKFMSNWSLSNLTPFLLGKSNWCERIITATK